MATSLEFDVHTSSEPFVCADHSLDILGHIFHSGIGEAIPHRRNFLVDLSDFLSELGLNRTLQEVQTKHALSTEQANF